jgi:hypothetical protein
MIVLVGSAAQAEIICTEQGGCWETRKIPERYPARSLSGAAIVQIISAHASRICAEDRNQAAAPGRTVGAVPDEISKLPEQNQCLQA